jgi:hypothetical protein
MAGEFEQAQRAWSRAESILTQQHVELSVGVDLCVLLGRFKHSQGELQQALDLFNKGREWATGEAARIAELKLRTALVLSDMNQHDQARAICTQIISAANGAEPPDELVGLLALASLVTNVTEADEWIARLKDGAGTPNRELAARIAVRTGELQEAVTLYSAAWKEHPSPVRRANIALALGTLFTSLGQSSDAKSWIARALDLAAEFRLPEIAWRAHRARSPDRRTRWRREPGTTRLRSGRRNRRATGTNAGPTGALPAAPCRCARGIAFWGVSARRCCVRAALSRTAVRSRSIRVMGGSFQLKSPGQWRRGGAGANRIQASRTTGAQKGPVRP